MSLAQSALFDARRFDTALAAQADALPLFRSALKEGREALKQAYLGGEPAPRTPD